MTLKETVILQVDPVGYYKSRFPDWNTTSNILCPWHDENTGSLKLHSKGGGAQCYGCGKSIGNVVHFEAEMFQISEDAATLKLYKEFVTKVVDKIPKPSYDSVIESDLGLNEEWSKYFKLSVNKLERRVFIPIFDQWGNCINIRRYRPPSWRKTPQDERLKCLSLEGHPAVELFPWQDIEQFKANEPVFLLKSERCTMLAISMGLQAFCSIAGEGVNLAQYAHKFRGLSVHIWHDQDESGLKGAHRRLEAFKLNGVDVHLFDSTGIDGDFWQWCQKGGGSKDDLLSRLPSSNIPKILTEEIPYINVSDIGQATKYLNQVVKVRAIVSGKTDKTYLVPNEFKIIQPYKENIHYKLDIGRDLLSLIRRNDEDIQSVIRRKVGANKYATVEPLSYVSVTDSLEIIPMASVDSEERYMAQRCHFIGENIDSNVAYEMTVIPTNDSKTQQSVGVITKIMPVSSTVDAFHLTPEIHEHFNKLFRCKPENTWDHCCNVATSLVKYTRIHNRLDWHLVALLSWASPLYFNFPHEGKQRGWINSLVIGDTETGKSKVAKTLREIFNCGSFTNAENCSYAGLVGGTFKGVGDQFMVRWGRIPLCDRQLVIMEELSGLSIEEISNLSDVRSSGMARLDKGGHNAETNSRTRLICLSNVRGSRTKGRRLSDYLSGVRAIQELIGQPEDISRFDLICTLIDSEVDPNVINSDKDEFTLPPSDIPAPLDWQNLMKFIWGLKDSQIEITDKAYAKILERTLELGKLYHASVPIFKASSGRHKLARIACSIACLCFNYHLDRILVEECHVEAAVNLLRMLYDKPSMGYDTYSRGAYQKEIVEYEKDLDSTLKQLVKNRIVTLKHLLYAERFTADELGSVAGTMPHDTNLIIGKMNASNLLVKDEANVWRISQIGKDWMQSKLQTLQAPFGSTHEQNGGLGRLNGLSKNGGLFGPSKPRIGQEKKRWIKPSGHNLNLANGQDESTEEQLES
jgi:hypothetical protein